MLFDVGAFDVLRVHPDQGFTQAVPRLPIPGAFMVERLLVDAGWEVVQRDKGEGEEELVSWPWAGTGTGRGETGWQRMPFEGKYSSCVVYHQLPWSYCVVLERGRAKWSEKMEQRLKKKQKKRQRSRRRGRKGVERICRAYGAASPACGVLINGAFCSVGDELGGGAGIQGPGLDVRTAASEGDEVMSVCSQTLYFRCLFIHIR